MARITSVTQRQFTVTAPDQSLASVLARNTFVIGTGFNNVVYVIALQPDGKILVGGAFTSYNGVTQNHITRLNTDGTRDTGFTIADFNNEVNVIALQPDGKILVGGTFTSYFGTTQNRISRLNADGTRDIGFVTGGGNLGFQTGFVNAIALQSDGKILVGGNFTSYDGVTQNDITRINADGSRDAGFVSGTGFNSIVYAIALQPDGKILVGGGFGSYNSVAQNCITRLNADGTRDTGFLIGTGFAGTISSVGPAVYAIAPQSDGKILVGGVFTSYDGVTQNCITRLNADGSRDTGFNIGTGFNNQVRAIALRPDGKILVCGDFTSYNGVTQNRITRLNADGSRDTSFDTLSANGSFRAIAVQPDNNILVGGGFGSYNSVAQNYIMRMYSSGQKQSSTQTFPVATYAVALTQFLNTGTTFEGGDVYAIAVQSDDKIVVGGAFNAYQNVYQNCITRINADGIRDPGFPTNLIASGGLGGLATNIAYAIAVQSDGKIVVGGAFTNYYSVSQVRITRLNTDGTRDTGFTIGTGFNQEVLAIAIQSDGKIVVGGFFTTYSGTTQRFIARLNVDGTRDTGFRGYEVGILNFNGAVRAIAIQSDGKILVGGSFNTASGTTSSYIARLNTDGSSDTSFTTAGTGISALIRSIAIQSDGKILVGGDFSTYNDVSQNCITRLNADGTRDTGFTIGTGFNGNVFAIALQSDGKILVGGAFTSYNGVTQNRITRLNADGSRDTSFVIGTGFSFGTVFAIKLQWDGGILVGGSFDSYNGLSGSRMLLLNTGGLKSTTQEIVKEGSPYNFVVTTANVRDGTVMRWRILDRPNDFAVNTNTVTVTSNTASFTVTPTADLQTEGAETFRAQLEKTTGTVVGTTSAVTINDTSLSP